MTFPALSSRLHARDCSLPLVAEASFNRMPLLATVTGRTATQTQPHAMT